MVTVIERHDPVIYQWTCKKCRSIFQFEEDDCMVSYDRMSRILEIDCPVCGKRTWSADPWKVITQKISGD